MAVLISMLRGVNLGAHRRMRMEDLRALYASLGLEDPHTYVQSGNVIFRTRERNQARLAAKIEQGIESRFGFHSDVILRAASDLGEVVVHNPFSVRREIEPAKLLVNFLARDPGEEAREKARRIPIGPEEMRIEGRELYIYFPNGQGRSKFPWAAVEKALGTSGTGRNWNSVLAMLEMANRLEK